jgi:peptide/nickel transport system substrate-binding protein
MRRRQLIAASGALFLPSIVNAQNSRVLRYVSSAGVVLTDPLATSIFPTFVLGLQIFESLYSVDEQLRPRPQMAAGHTIEDNGKRWIITLRGGLRFHDGEPVLARDCVASINRWMKRDASGQTLASRLDALEAPDDRSVVFRLKKPFPQLPYVLGKTMPYLLAIMPTRLAAADPNQPITELIGSGPYRFVANEFSANSLAVLARFEAYQPRDEPPSGASGGRIAKLDRVEWRVIPEPSTQVNALMTGEIDWLGGVTPDLLPAVRGHPQIATGVIDPFGSYPVLRPNHVSGPTANAGIRRAIMATLDGREIIAAALGDEPGMLTAPIGVFAPGSPSENSAGMEHVGPKPLIEVRAMLKQAGYANEPLVLLHQTDVATQHAMLQVVAKRLAEAGFNVDDQIMDLANVVKRRNSREAPDKGGWSLQLGVGSCVDSFSPLLNIGLRTGAAAWIGWPDDPVMEDLRDQWLDSTDDAERKRLAGRIQETALTDVLVMPLGRYQVSSAWRSNVSGILKMNMPIMWNVSKS